MTAFAQVLTLYQPGERLGFVQRMVDNLRMPAYTDFAIEEAPTQVPVQNPQGPNTVIFSLEGMPAIDEQTTNALARIAESVVENLTDPAQEILRQRLLGVLNWLGVWMPEEVYELA